MRKFRDDYERRTGQPYKFKRNPDRVQRESAERRALSRDARVGEPFTRKEVGDRDGWKCWLCGEAIDQAMKWPDPMSQSLEHKVPLVLGGDHSQENCTVAHLGCNSKDGAKHRKARAGMHVRIVA
jgi:5-methylcytosine-specific restriction endonuclease McrA